MRHTFSLTILFDEFVHFPENSIGEGYQTCYILSNMIFYQTDAKLTYFSLFEVNLYTV